MAKSLAGQRRGLTQRAVDNWESPRFLRGFNTLAAFRFQSLRASRPVATNASRWALNYQQCIPYDTKIVNRRAFQCSCS
jgi:hypothetical protein